MLQKVYLIIILLLFTFNNCFAIPYQTTVNIKWNGVQKIEIEKGFETDRIGFEGAYYADVFSLPKFIHQFPIHTAEAKLNASISNITYINVSPEETKLLLKAGFSDTSIFVQSSIVLSRKEPSARIEILPIKWNEKKQIFQKLLSFELITEVIDLPFKENSAAAYKNSSVLATGDWFKIRIDQSGMYKITYDELNAMGFDVSGDPRQIAVFGNGGGILPEKNDEFRHDDLIQNPILVVGENDGSFDGSDYILFYGEGPITWKYNQFTGRFQHQNNYYDNYSYYFITRLNEQGQRIQEQEIPSGSADIEISDFTDYVVHEVDEVNIAGTGRVWYGEIFDFNNTLELSFPFPNVITTPSSASYAGSFGAKAYSKTYFDIHINENFERRVEVDNISSSNRYQIAQKKGVDFKFTPKNENLTVKLTYLRSSSSAVGYLDYIELNVMRMLKMAGSQMSFRKNIGAEADIARYTLENANSNISVWDITNPLNAHKVETQLSSGKITFTADADTLKEFIAFDGESYLQTEFVEAIENQNLHSVLNIDYLLISPPDFLDQAKRLAEFHRTEDGMAYYIATPEQIYNEYSSGSQDITAIRDFTKRLYDHSDAGKEIKYVLFFGDASYDYKDRIINNTNFVPCWESLESLNIVNSIATDDYFAYLDDGEGASDADRVDVGIGRFVVVTPEEAEMAVDKCISYASNSDEVMEPWRNVLTFVADDEDSNRHLKDAEILSDFIADNHNVYNVDKIYVDAYEQISTPAGQRAPLVNQAINDRIEQGTMIFNYSGHGGEIGMGHERFLTTADINSWTNYDHLSVFITATCEFSRFDDPTRVSAGELVFLNANGGGIALFSTARATYAGANLALNKAIYEDNLFTKIDGKYPCFGDVIRKSKKLGGSNDKKFLLLGDPALKLAYTEHTANTIKINSNVLIENQPDTIKALELVMVEGNVTDQEGQILENFNGTIFPKIFDKASEIQTLGTDGGSVVTTFSLYKNLLFNGKASIVNGEFSYEFMVPKDIAYKYGNGRISYYLKDEMTDGNGYTENFLIGGVDENANPDTKGPEINLFMNDTTFVSGDRTSQSPTMLAYVADESGINTTGNGIGHDITAILNDDQSQSYILNQYYESKKNSFNQGIVTYPFKDLEDGEHVLSFKVWDVYNNSSTAELQFLVTTDQELIIENLMNYPNPFLSETNFIFDHNQSGQELDITIQIYNSTGMLIRTLETVITPETFKSPPLHWNARSDNGGQIGRGFYVYRLIVKKQDGTTAEARSKLVFIKH